MKLKVFNSKKAGANLRQSQRAGIVHGQARRWYKRNMGRFKIIHLLVGKSGPDTVLVFAYA